MKIDLYSNLSPLDHRYRLSRPELHEKLGRYLDERSAIRYQCAAEIALLKTHLTDQKIDPETIESILGPLEIDPEEVYREEEKTRHNIRALINVISRKIPAEYRPYLHLGATSMDIVDTANAMRLRDAVTHVVLPELYSLQKSLIELAEREAGTTQVGRTHGQFAVPITLGFAIASYVSRLGQSIEQILRLSRDLRGKLSGAVGGYNATLLISTDPQQLELRYLRLLDLKPAEYSNQIVMPEYQLRLLLEINLAFGVIANLADDLRHLQRSEIDEVHEFFSSEQVGSSTMPQKRNPWNCEHVKSLWKAFAPRIVSFYMDQISEHQRDLSNSASARFIADFIAGFCFAVSRIQNVVQKLDVNYEALKKNLTGQGGDLILAEPLYILLALGGVQDAHEKLRQLTLECQKTNVPLTEAIQKDPVLWPILEQQLQKTDYTGELLQNPSLYTGRCREKTLALCQKYRKLLPAQ